MPSDALARLAADAALDRKARNVVLIDLRELKTFADFFLICTGTSDTHVEGITDAVLDRLREHGQRPWHREGERNASWVLLDYVDVVVHVFTREARDFYALERLWADAPIARLSDDDGDEGETGDADYSPSLVRFSAMDALQEEPDDGTFAFDPDEDEDATIPLDDADDDFEDDWLDEE